MTLPIHSLKLEWCQSTGYNFLVQVLLKMFCSELCLVVLGSELSIVWSKPPLTSWFEICSRSFVISALLKHQHRHHLENEENRVTHFLLGLVPSFSCFWILLWQSCCWDVWPGCDCTDCHVSEQSGHTLHTHTACPCVPCRHTVGRHHEPFLGEPPGSSAEWRPSHTQCT